MTVTAYFKAIDCSVTGNDVILWSGTGETFNLIVTVNSSACKVTEYAWYYYGGGQEYLTDESVQGLFVFSGQKTNKLVVSKVEGGAYGIRCIVTFENGQQDTLDWPTAFKPKVSFNPGDGSGSMDDQVFTPGVSFKLNKCSFTRTGYRFAGWCIDSECTRGYAFGDQATVTFNNEWVYLTASWVEE